MSTPPPPIPSPVDRHLHRAALATPHNGGYLGVLGVLEGRPPSLGQLRELVADTVPRVPAWNYRVSADNRRVWEPAEGGDPREQVHAVHVPEGPAVLERVAQAVHDAPFPAGADNWGVWLVTGFARDRYAIACRVHHALQDAAGGMAGISAVMVPGLELPLTVPPDAEPPLRVATAARWLARTLPALVRPTARWSPVRAAAGPTRTLHFTTCDTSRLEAVARAAGASVNQVYLTVTAGALRHWTPEDWNRAVRPLHSFVPVESRPPGYEMATLGNHLVAMRAELHCSEPDPRRRLELVRSSTDKRAAHVPQQRAALRHLPLIGALTTRWLLNRSRSALLTSSMHLGGGLSVNGDPVRQVMSLPPLLFGQPLTVALTTYEGQATVCFTSDRDSPDPSVLPHLWQDALRELEKAYALASPRSAPATWAATR